METAVHKIVLYQARSFSDVLSATKLVPSYRHISVIALFFTAPAISNSFVFFHFINSNYFNSNLT